MVEVTYCPHHSDFPDRFVDGRSDGFYRRHYCNKDSGRAVYVDLTQDQFISTLPGVVVIPVHTEILVDRERVPFESIKDKFNDEAIEAMDGIIERLRY